MDGELNILTKAAGCGGSELQLVEKCVSELYTGAGDQTWEEPGGAQEPEGA